MTDVDLLHSEVEEDLRRSVRAVLDRSCDPAALSAMYDGAPAPDGLWRSLAVDLGLAGLLVPEDRGGAGAGAREAAVVMEEVGRAVAPVPFLTSSVVATRLLLEAGSDLVGALAAGEQVAALVVPFSLGAGDPLPGCTTEQGRLTGRVRSVAGAAEADLLLVPVPGPDGVAVHAVPADRAGVQPVVSLDMTRPVADVVLDRAGGEVVAEGPAGRAAVRSALLTGAGLLASEQAGLAARCLEATVGYLQERRQFGEVVGGYQALKHRLADLFVEVEQALAAARYAAGTLAQDDPDAEVAAHVAQAWCSDVAVHAAQEAVQLHGGIGMTWEHPAHLWLKRAKADQLALGTPGRHRDRLAVLVDLPGPVDTVAAGTV